MTEHIQYINVAQQTKAQGPNAHTQADWNEMKWVVGSGSAGGRGARRREGERVFIMVSNFDMLALRSVPVHPSSSSPTDEHWKQIWGRPALFCRLGDLSESSLGPCVADVSPAQFHPLGLGSSLFSVPPIHYAHSVFSFITSPSCSFYPFPKCFYCWGCSEWECLSCLCAW